MCLLLDVEEGIEEEDGLRETLGRQPAQLRVVQQLHQGGDVVAALHSCITYMHQYVL